MFYELSIEAEQDLDEIFDHTAFGRAQAVDYLAGIDTVLDDLVRNPDLGCERREIKVGLRSIVHESHLIYYRNLGDRLRILRVLHASRDIFGIPME